MSIFLNIIIFPDEVFVRTQKCYKFSFDVEIVGKVRIFFFFGGGWRGGGAKKGRSSFV